jgi:hypothetical protein
LTAKGFENKFFGHDGTCLNIHNIILAKLRDIVSILTNKNIFIAIF